MTDRSKAELDLDAIEARAEAATENMRSRARCKCYVEDYDGHVVHESCGFAADRRDEVEVFLRQVWDDVPALVRELREARRERDGQMALAREWERLRHDAYRLYRDTGDKLDQSNRDLADLRAALAASEKRCAELEADVEALRTRTECGGRMVDLTDPNDACQSARVQADRAERAEAACAQMRAFLQEFYEALYELRGDEATGGFQEGQSEARRTRSGMRPVRAPEPTEPESRTGGRDARGIETIQVAPPREGQGTAPQGAAFNEPSAGARGGAPEAAERGGFGEDREADRLLGMWQGMRTPWAPPGLQPSPDRGVAVLAVPWEAASRVLVALATDAGKALAERVRLLEAVAEHAPRGETGCICHLFTDGKPCWCCSLRAALAALDAHDKQGGRHE